MTHLTERILGLYRAVLRDPGNVKLIVELTHSLSDSGESRSLDPCNADVASSGGPSSLSTLLCPLYLVGAGLRVPKIGVPGRPAGGIDVLGTVRNYRTQLSATEFDQVVQTAGYAHVSAGQTWAPADSALFSLRQQEGTQAQPALAIASLLAKKLAAGVTIAGLDARVAPHGNFGTKISEARRNADLYSDVATQLGLRPIVVLTDATVPYQPYIGRSEALIALVEALSGHAMSPWLESHVLMCKKLSSIVSDRRDTILDDSVQAQNPPAPITTMSANLVAQGSSWAELEAQARRSADDTRVIVTARHEGFAHYNIPQIRRTLASSAPMMSPKSEHSQEQYPDISGVRLLSAPWHEVHRGDPIIEFRSKDRPDIAALVDLVEVRPHASDGPNRILEVVS